MRARRTIEAWIVATSLVACAAIALVHCGGTSCGNGKKEAGEACDEGKNNGVENSGCSSTCEIAALDYAQLQIFVTRLQNEAVGYTGAMCSDLKASTEHVVLEGPTPADGFTQDWDCTSKNSLIVPSVTPGDYKVTVTLMNGATALTKPVSATGTASKGSQVTLTVNFAQTDFIEQDYVGTLYYAPSWGSDNTGCATASPPVTGYGVTLKDKTTGALVGGMSTANRLLDGTSAGCFTPGSNGTAEGVAGIPWGHYDLTLTGYAGPELAYCKTFDVFNGPSVANVTYALTVPAADADAGSCD